MPSSGRPHRNMICAGYVGSQREEDRKHGGTNGKEYVKRGLKANRDDAGNAPGASVWGVNGALVARNAGAATERRLAVSQSAHDAQPQPRRPHLANVVNEACQHHPVRLAQRARPLRRLQQVVYVGQGQVRIGSVNERLRAVPGVGSVCGGCGVGEEGA